jgi:type I restriction enzyme S subunit
MLLLQYFDELTLQPQNAKKLKGLILELAVRGKLTKKWRIENPNTESATKLLTQIKAEKKRLIAAKEIRKEKPLPKVEAEEIPFGLPENWIWCRLGNITNNLGHKKPNEDFHYIDVATVDNKKGLIRNEIKIIKSDNAPSRARKIVKKGCVIYSTVRPYLKNIAIIKKEYIPKAIASTAFAVLYPTGGYSFNYLYYYLHSICFTNYVESKMKGVAYPAINDKKLYMGFVALPPLSEQKAIVKIVEQLFEEVEILERLTEERLLIKQNYTTAILNRLANKNTEATWQQLLPQFEQFFDTEKSIKALRQTILQLAVQGKLTKDWRKANPNTSSATELLQQIKTEKKRLIAEKVIKKEKVLPKITKEEIPFELPENWEICRLIDIVKNTEAGKSPKCLNRPANEDEWGVLKTTAIQNLYFLQNQNKAYPSGFKTKINLEVKQDDILITRAGPYNRVGIVTHVGEVRTKLLLSDKTVRINHIKNYVFSPFLSLTLSSGLSKDFLDEKKSGMAKSQVNISQNNLKLTPILLPPLSEQKAIVEKAAILLGYCDALEAAIAERGKRVEALMDGSLSGILGV